jgi:hypothetical protein
LSGERKRKGKKIIGVKLEGRLEHSASSWRENQDDSNITAKDGVW